VAELVQTSGYKGSEEVLAEALREHKARRQGMEVEMHRSLNACSTRGWKTWTRPRLRTLCVTVHDSRPVQSQG